MSRSSLLILILTVVVAGCGLTSEADDDQTEETPAPREVVVGDEDDEGIVAETTTTLSPLEDDEDAEPLEIATLLPIESGTFEGRSWIKWKLDRPIPDPIDVHTTYQLNIESAEDDLFGLGWTIPIDGAPFASGFCFEDRPNCDDGTVAVDVEVGPLGNELIFFAPQPAFGNATGLEIEPFIQTFPPGEDPVAEFVGGGATVPMGFNEGDPC